MTQPRGQDFARLVYTVLVIEKRWRIEEIAERMNMKYDTLYARISGRVPFSAEEIRALIRHAPDPRLADYVLQETNFVAIDRVVADDRIDHRDRATVMREIDDAERSLASLRQRVGAGTV